jgi:hypothetical protein
MFSCLPGALRVSTRNDFVLKSFVNAVASSLFRKRGRIIPEPWHRVRRAVLRPLLSPEGVQKDHGRGRQQNKRLAGNPIFHRGHTGDTIIFQLDFFSVSRSIATTFPWALRLAGVIAWA